MMISSRFFRGVVNASKRWRQFSLLKIDTVYKSLNIKALQPVAPVAQRYHVTSDTLGREFDPGKRDFPHRKTKK